MKVRTRTRNNVLFALLEDNLTVIYRKEDVLMEYKVNKILILEKVE
jgi:hypothetical protein